MLICDYIVEMIDGDYASFEKSRRRKRRIKTGCKSTASG